MDSPLVRLRVRVLRCVRDDQDRSARTVFCPARLRSVNLDNCLLCPRFSRVTENAIECTPLPSERLGRELPGNFARLCADARVGDAMGDLAISVHADLTTSALERAGEAEGATVAIVVDDDGRLLGLIDVDDAARGPEHLPARELARRIAPVQEAAPLIHAVDRMVRERARALPVVDEDGYVVALITDLDALRWVAHRGAL